MALVSFKAYLHKNITNKNFENDLKNHLKIIVTKWGRRRVVSIKENIEGTMSFKQFKAYLHKISYDTKTYKNNRERILLLKVNRKILDQFDKKGYRVVKQKGIITRLFHAVRNFFGQFKAPFCFSISYATKRTYEEKCLSKAVSTKPLFKDVFNGFYALTGNKKQAQDRVKQCLERNVNPTIVLNIIKKGINRGTCKNLLKVLKRVKPKISKQSKVDLTKIPGKDPDARFYYLWCLILKGDLFTYRYLPRSREILYFFNQKDFDKYCSEKNETGSYFIKKEKAIEKIMVRAISCFSREELQDQKKNALVKKYVNLKNKF